jgi:hypothetical protein
MGKKNPASWAVAAIAWRLHHVRRATESYLLKRRKSYFERQGYGTYLSLLKTRSGSN